MPLQKPKKGEKKNSLIEEVIFANDLSAYRSTYRLSMGMSACIHLETQWYHTIQLFLTL